MAIIEVFEKIEGASAKVDRMGNATYTRVFGVIADDSRTRPGAAITAVGFKIGDAYKVLDPADGVTVLEDDDSASCQEISAALAGSSDDGCQWDVTVTYGPAGGEAATFPKNPLEHPVKLSWGSERFEVPVERDRDDLPILNAAGDVFDPLPTRDDSRIVLKIVRNEETFSPTLAQTWKHTINDAPFEIAGETFDTGTVLISDITGEPVFNPECGWYWPVNYEFIIKPEGWTRKILEQGMKYLDASDNKHAILDKDGKPVTTPELLAADGSKLAAGAEPVFTDFDIYPESDFSLLELSFTGTPGY